jgi:hypothetical protein
MFEWLEKEILSIKTPRFHLVDGAADSKLREAVVNSNFSLPPSYKEFVLKFGNAKLYRDAHNDSYRLGIFAGPRLRTLDDGTRICHIGWHDGASVYVKPSSNLSVELPIFEFEEDEEERVADTFEDWLKGSCASARSKYSKEKWAEILQGPRPFTPAETKIVEARKLIRWKVLGIDTEGRHILEISNVGHHRLAVLTVGVRSKDQRLNGAVRLRIGHIAPGQKDLIHVDCYKDLVPPQEIEIFSLPDPEPEDRDYYWEFEEITPKS